LKKIIRKRKKTLRKLKKKKIVRSKKIRKTKHKKKLIKKSKKRKKLKPKSKKILNLKNFDGYKRWIKILQYDLKQKDSELLKLQKQYDERSKWTLDLDKKLKQRDDTITKLQKQYDERSQWALDLDKKFKEKDSEILKIQKQYDERSQWAQELDKNLKQRDETIIKLQKQYDERSKWTLDLDKKFKEKDSEILKLQKQYDQRSKWTLDLDMKLKQRDDTITKLQKQYDERSQWALDLDEKLKQRDETITKLQKQYDERSKWTLDLDKKFKEKDSEILKIQKQYDERSQWALELDEKLKQRDDTITKLQKQYDEGANLASQLKNENEKLNQIVQDVRKSMQIKESEVSDIQTSLQTKESELKDIQTSLQTKESELKDIQTSLQTKDSQLQNIQNELESKQRELDNILNSVVFNITSRIARGFGKIAPESTRRGDVLKSVADAYMVKKKNGSKALLKAAISKAGKKKLARSNLRQIPEVYLQPIKGTETQLGSNVIKIEEKFEPDNGLRESLRFGEHNITNLTKFPMISIIIITLDQLDALKRNLSSIEEKSTYKNYEIIIVTNNQDENSEMRKFLSTLKHTVCVYNKEYSFGGMNNFGASKAKGEFLLFLNDDVEIVYPNWLEAFLSLALNKSTGAVGGKLLSSNGKLQDCGGIVWQNGNAWNYGRNYDADDPQFNYVRDVDYCSGSCLFVKTDIFNKVGGFDSMFDPAYWEDADLCFSIQKLGYRVLYQPLAKLVHYEGMTQGTSTQNGLKSYQVVNQKKFYEKWKTELESHLDDSVQNTLLECNRKEGLNILYIDHYVPEPDQDSGSLRTFRILCTLSHMGNKITIWPENLNYTTPYVSEFQQKGIEVIYGSNDFDKFLEERKSVYDVVIMARPYVATKYIDLIKSKLPNCKIIYDTIDLHFLRMLREDSFDNKSNTNETEKMRELEFSLMKKSDVTILTSTAEAKLLHKEDNSLKFSILPNIHIETENIEKFETRKDMFFLGGFQHTPNINAAEFLVNDIWPIIKQKISDVKLYIVGSHATETVKKLASNDIVITGFVNDLSPYYQKCKVMLAPLRYGAGVKGKITQSLAMGLPVVTTPIGVEGTDLVDKQNCMVAEKPEEFASKATQVYTDKELWNKLSINGLKAASEYSPEKAKACLTATISSIIQSN